MAMTALACNSALARDDGDAQACAQIQAIERMDAAAVRSHAKGPDPNDILGHDRLTDLTIGPLSCSASLDNPVELSCAAQGDPGVYEGLVSFTRSCTSGDIKKGDPSTGEKKTYFWFTSGAMLKIINNGGGAVVMKFVY